MRLHLAQLALPRLQLARIVLIVLELLALRVPCPGCEAHTCE